MKEQKQTYLSPETETLVVRFEGIICESTNEAVSTKSDWENKGGWI